MQPEPPEFHIGEKVTFKHIKREPEKTTFTRQVGAVTGIGWTTPFYEFTLSGEHVDFGRWYKQTELEKYKEGDDLLNRTAEAALLSTTRSALETGRAETNSLRNQNEALSSDITRQAAELESLREQVATLTKAAEGHDAVNTELETARSRIAELEKELTGREGLEAIVERLERLGFTTANVIPGPMPDAAGQA